MPDFHPVSIGSVQVPGNLFLAPMAGYTDPAFRKLCLDNGACLTYTEMVSAEGLARGGQPTLDLLRRAPGENELAVQIFGDGPSVIRRCLDNLLACKPTIIDINCGCPVPKVIKTGCGSALMQHPRLIYEMVKAIKDSCQVPVTVKFRLGFDHNSINYMEFAEQAQEAGVDGMCLHARTRSDFYAGKADWSAIKALKEQSSVPVFGSGDVMEAIDAVRMLEETGCDAVMIARGAIGNPFIFLQARSLLEGKGELVIGLDRRKSVALAQLRCMIADKGELKACREFRKCVAGYIKGIEKAASVRRQAMEARCYDDYVSAFARLE